MHALLDMDIIAFSCAAFNEGFGWEDCREDMDDMIARILETTQSDSYVGYLSGPDNFRYDVNPNYKSNRSNKVDPRYREDAKAYLIERYGAILTIGNEADDELAIAQSEETIICSIDKDLKQCAGRHYNWRKNEFDFVDPVDGLRLFYRQCLTGDSTDGIPGVGGIGAVKSARIINDLEDEIDMFEAVQAIFNDDTRLLMHGRCLKIGQRPDKLWSFPDTTKRGEEEPSAL